MVNKQHHHLFGKREDEQHGNDEIAEHYLYSRLDAERDAIKAARPDILSAVSRHGNTDVLEDTGEKIFYSHRCREGSHVYRAERIVGTLQHDAADGGNRKLQSHGHSVVQERHSLPVVVVPFFALRNEQRHLLLDIGITQPCRHCLGKESGDGSSGYAKPHDDDEEEIEHDICYRREYQKIKRLLGIAKGADKTRQEIVAEGEGDGGKLQNEICISITENLLWRVYHPQNGRTKQTGDYGDDSSEDYRQAEGIGNIMAHCGKRLGTERLCHGDGEAGTGSVAEAHDEEHH